MLFVHKVQEILEFLLFILFYLFVSRHLYARFSAVNMFNTVFLTLLAALIDYDVVEGLEMLDW